MTRVLFIPLVLALAIPAQADDDLEAQLQQIEARVAKLRAAAKRESEATAKLDVRIAALDREIEERTKADPTALGATRIADLRAEREKLETEKRRLRRSLARGSRELDEGVAKIEKQEEPIDLVGLLERAQKGDAQARAELAKLRDRIATVIGIPVMAPGGQQQVIALGNGGFQIVNRVRVANGILLGSQPPAKEPAEAAEPRKEVPAEEQAKRDAEDLTDQQKRAAELEARIVAMTRELMELERRVEELKQKVAQPDRD